MNTGPLTPPGDVDPGVSFGASQASTQTQDSSAHPPSEPGPSTYAAVPTVYEKLLPTIADLSAQGRIHEIISTAEEGDLTVRLSFMLGWGLVSNDRQGRARF